MLAGEHCFGETEGEVYSWLRITTHRQLGDLRRRNRVDRELATDPAAPELTRRPGVAPSPEEVVLEREDHAQVVRLTRAALDPLTEPQRQVVALHSHGHRRNEIARQLGVTPRRVKRALEQSMTAGREQLVQLAGPRLRVRRAARDAAGVRARQRPRGAPGAASPRDLPAVCRRCTSGWTCGARRSRPCSRSRPPSSARPGAVEAAVDRIADALASAQTARRRDRRRRPPARHGSDRPGQAARDRRVSTDRRPDPAGGGAAGRGGGRDRRLSGDRRRHDLLCVSQNVNPVGGLTHAFSDTTREQAQAAHRPRRRTRATPTPSPTATPTPISTPTATPTSTPTPQAPTPTATPQPPPAHAREPTPEPTPPPAPQDEYEPTNAAAAAATPDPGPRRRHRASQRPRPRADRGSSSRDPANRQEDQDAQQAQPARLRARRRPRAAS